MASMRPLPELTKLSLLLQVEGYGFQARGATLLSVHMLAVPVLQWYTTV